MWHACLSSMGAAWQGATKVKLGATAGLRLLPEGKADIILAAVRTFLGQYPFQLDPAAGVTILDGAQPALGWAVPNLTHVRLLSDNTMVFCLVPGVAVCNVCQEQTWMSPVSRHAQARTRARLPG